nr:dipeptidase 1-like [Leptinotarsa decemlineata]
MYCYFHVFEQQIDNYNRSKEQYRLKAALHQNDYAVYQIQRSIQRQQIQTQTPYHELPDEHTDQPNDFLPYIHGQSEPNSKEPTIKSRHQNGRWEELLESLEPGEDELWRVTRRLRRKKIASSPIHGERGVCYSPADKALVFAYTMEGQFELNVDDNDNIDRNILLEDRVHRILREDGDDNIRPASVEELKDIRGAYKRHQLCSLIGVEGGHSLAGSLAVLRTLYHVGVRYLTLTSTCNTPWADCSLADMPGKKAEHGGLTNFGKSVIKEMNRIGMIVDLSHVSVNTMKDALEVSKAPVIFSHSSAHALCNSTRNVPDDTLRKLALNKGVIMINFYSLFLTCKETSTIADAVAHINHIREVAGVDSVGLGAGYDGINFVPQGLEDVSTYPTLFAELIGTGKWSVDDLKKLAGMNFLRVFQEAERVRDEFKRANVPPYEDVMPKQKENNCSSQSN